MRYLKLFLLTILCHNVYAKSSLKSWVYVKLTHEKHEQIVMGKISREQYVKVTNGSLKKGFFSLEDACKVINNKLEKVGSTLFADSASFKVADVVQIGRLKGDPHYYPLRDITGSSVQIPEKQPASLFYLDLDEAQFCGYNRTTTAETILKDISYISRTNYEKGVYAYAFTTDNKTHQFKFNSNNELSAIIISGEKGLLSCGTQMGMEVEKIIELMDKPEKHLKKVNEDEKLIYLYTDFSLYLHCVSKEGITVLDKVEVIMN